MGVEISRGERKEEEMKVGKVAMVCILEGK